LSGKRGKHIPLRTCIACRQKRPKRDLIRVVRTPDGSIQVDPRGKQAGRGAYVCASRPCWDIVLAENRLGRALKCNVTAQDAAALEAFALSLPTEVVSERSVPAVTVEQAEQQET
jgi:hypothetical protein